MSTLSSGATKMGLVRGYAPRPGAFDEMMDPEGHVRPMWRKLLTQLDALGDAELARRWEKARQLIHENGVSYNVHGDPRGLERPWNLSLIPVVIAPDDWAQLSLGLAQRARLLAALLADLYGPQRSLTEGWIPPALLFGNPHFLRPLHGALSSPSDWLSVLGADLLRTADGSFAVLEDRIEAPTGAGYALENRIVISSALPESFRECNVERLAPFFRVMRETLRERAPHNRDHPRIVLLTPGPYDATYFEQAYLAQYLGFTLVNGGDLTVRDDRVYLKTLGGLQPVDVVFRRLGGGECDPLELRADSMLGVPGLVQAVRARNVAVANALGSGLLQTPAFLPYLPAVCRGLLGESLAIPSVPTWWCGDDAALPAVLARFDNLVIRPLFPDGNSTGNSAGNSAGNSTGNAAPVFTGALTTSERDELRDKVRARPAAWVAQEHVVPSTTPFLDESTFAPRTLVLRAYAVAARNHDYMVMPGGLARVAGLDDGAEVTMQHGARSKDIWVLSNEAVAEVSLLRDAERPVVLSRGGSELASRVADNLYWLGRYAERAEGIARLARVLTGRLSEVADQSELARSSEFGPLLAALRAQNELLYSADIPVDGAPTLAGAEAQLVAAVRDRDNVGSLAAVVAATVRAGRLVRDRISADTWRVLAALDEELGRFSAADPAGADRLSVLTDRLNHVVITLAAFSGLAMESMTRGQAWRFLDMGRRLERAGTLLTLLRATMVRGSDRERLLCEAVLDIADSGMTYRRRYLATLQTAPVLDLLLVDDTNPRSVLYQLRALADHVRALPPLPGAGVKSPQLRLVVGAQNELELTEVERLCETDARGDRPALDAALRHLGTVLPAISDSLSDSYLNHAMVPRHLTGGGEP
jgi:uncharacterized circularly permuted ATP-grasp superfamily protein/uncharacterized alpha-E superfamily protein